MIAKVGRDARRGEDARRKGDYRRGRKISVEEHGGQLDDRSWNSFADHLEAPEPCHLSASVGARIRVIVVHSNPVRIYPGPDQRPTNELFQELRYLMPSSAATS